MFNFKDFARRLFQKKALKRVPWKFKNLVVNFIIDDAMPDTDLFKVVKSPEGDLRYLDTSIGGLVEDIIKMHDYDGIFGEENLAGYQCNTDVYYHIIGMYNYMTKGERSDV